MRALRFLSVKRLLSKGGKAKRILGLAVVLPGAWVLVVGGILVSTHGSIYGSASEVPPAPIGIVLGAAVMPNGNPSPVLQARLDGAIELYREHKISRFLMSGDNRTSHYNEPKAMLRYAMRRHIDPSKILLDFAGRDTYDTCYRAKKVFGVDKAIVITQQYHAPRAVYLGRSLGIDVVAYGVKNLPLSNSKQWRFDFRELCADLKAVWDVNVSHRRPYVDQQSRVAFADRG